MMSWCIQYALPHGHRCYLHVLSLMNELIYFNPVSPNYFKCALSGISLLLHDSFNDERIPDESDPVHS